MLTSEDLGLFLRSEEGSLGRHRQCTELEKLPLIRMNRKATLKATCNGGVAG